MTTIKNYWNTTTVAPNGTWHSSVPDYKETIIVGAGGAGLSTAITMALRNYKELLVVDAILPAWRGARKGIGAATLMNCASHHLYKNGVSSPDSFKALRMCHIGIRNINEYVQRFWPDTDWCRKLNFGGFHIALNTEEEKILEDVNKFYHCGQVASSLMKSAAISKLTDMRIGHDGIFVPTECMINPAKFFNGMITGIRTLGVDIISGFVVDNVYKEGIHWVISDSCGNTIRCKNLIIATGANLAALPTNDELESFMIRKRVTYFATPPITNHRLNPYVISSLDGAEIYRRYDNRIIGSIDTNDGLPTDMKEPEKSALENALHRISILYPLTPNEKDFEFVWTKNILQTKDSLPIVGEIGDLKNLYLNIGYNHHSLAWQMIGGAVLAELILGSTKASGQEIFSPERIFK